MCTAPFLNICQLRILVHVSGWLRFEWSNGEAGFWWFCIKYVFDTRDGLSSPQVQVLGRNPYNVSKPWQINGVCFAWDSFPWVCVCGHASPQHSFMFLHRLSPLLHAAAIERTAVSPLPFLLGLVKACASATMHKWLWSRACCARRGLPCTTMWGVWAVGCLGVFVVHLLRNLLSQCAGTMRSRGVWDWGVCASCMEASAGHEKYDAGLNVGAVAAHFTAGTTAAVENRCVGMLPELAWCCRGGGRVNLVCAGWA